MLRGSLRSPLVDLTTLQGVESLFGSGVKDPFGVDAIAQFTDLLLYSDEVRFPIPYVGARPSTSDAIAENAIISAFDTYLPATIKAVPFSARQRLRVAEDTATGALDSLHSFVRANPSASKALIKLHGKANVREEYSQKLAKEFLFDVEAVSEDRNLLATAKRLQCEPRLLLHTLDMVLRYPMYGSLAGKDEWYLGHLVRTAVALPNLGVQHHVPPAIPLPIGDLVYRVGRRDTMEQYALRVCEVRDLLDENGIRGVRRGDVERSVIRHVSQEAGLPGKLRGYHRSMGVTTGLLGFVGLWPFLGTPAAAGAAALTTGSAMWDGKVPSRLSGSKWLRFAIRYDLEDRIPA